MQVQLVNVRTNQSQSIGEPEAAPANKISGAAVASDHTIVVVPSGPGTVERVDFALNGVPVRSEGLAPYAINGDANGVLNAYPLKPGKYTLLVTEVRRVEFEVVDDIPRPQPDLGFTKLPLATGARMIHVANDGDDANTGTTAAPVRTIGKAYSLLRDGTGDRIALKAGHRFYEDLWWKKSGPDGFPTGVVVYGEGPRPFVRSINLLHGVNVAFVGLEAGNPARNFMVMSQFNVDASVPNTGFRLVVDGLTKNILVEDCLAQFGHDNLAAHPYNAGSFENLTIRRNIFQYAWSTKKFGGQGIYANKVKGLIIEGNVLVNNGRLPLSVNQFPQWANHDVVKNESTLFTQYRHNLYIAEGNTGVVIRDNIIKGGASFGAQNRAGGVIAGNLFDDNAMHAMNAGAKGDFLNNVVLGGHYHTGTENKDAGKAGYFHHSNTGICRGNFFIDDGRTVAGKTALPAIVVGRRRDPGGSAWTPPGDVTLAIDGNVFHQWVGKPGGSVDITRNRLALSAPADWGLPPGFYMSASKRERGTWDVRYTARAVYEKLQDFYK